MENNKYYAPEILEFYIGFKYEVNYDFVLTALERYQQKSTWYSKVFEVKDYEFIEHQIKTNYVRVKYLDKQDIEELNWVFATTELDILEIYYIDREAIDEIESKFILTRNIKEKFITIELEENYLFDPITNPTETHRIFQGKLKNKNELKVLMRQLNII